MFLVRWLAERLKEQPIPTPEHTQYTTEVVSEESDGLTWRGVLCEGGIPYSHVTVHSLSELKIHSRSRAPA